MPLPCRDTVRSVLEINDRDLRLRSAVEQAWSDVQSTYSTMAWWRRLSTTRAVMWEHSVDRVMEVVEEDNGLTVVKHHDTASFIADDKVLFRLKNAGPGLLSQNYPTRQARLFHQHEQSADLFGHPGLQRVEIVHTLNTLRTALDWVGVVARDGKKVIWEFELRRGGAEVIAFPAQPQAPAGKTVLRPIFPEVGDQADESK